MARPCFCSIVPPHLLLEISKNSDQFHRQAAIHTLIAFSRLRGQRDLLADFPAMVPPGTKQRTVYTANHFEQLPGRMVRSEGDSASGNASADRAYDGSGFTYDFYKTIFKRNSLDGRGMRLDSTVNFGRGYDNAYWNGGQMVYGDGDGATFGDFTTSLDVIGHELTHGVVQYSCDLVYQGQPGALNESLADVFGTMVKQWAKKQSVDQADWLIGDEVFAPDKVGVALRSLKAPGTAYDDLVMGKDPQPAHMKDYQDMSFDDGGVHINSGIPNHAFYLACMKMGGNSWDKAGPVWYDVMVKKASQHTDFQEFANLTTQSAGELYGVDGVEQKAVVEAWAEVGIVAYIPQS